MLAEKLTQLKFVEDLKLVNLFFDIKDSPDAIAALSSLVREEIFSRGHKIIEEEKSGEDLFILVQGRASVNKSTPQGDHYKVAILNGDKKLAFGEGGLVGDDQRSATIMAESECRCLILHRKDFEDFSQKYPQWALPIYKRIAQAVMSRLKKTNTDMLLLYNALVAEIRGG